MNSHKATETKSTGQQRGTNGVAAAPQPLALSQRLGNHGFGQLLRARRLQAKLTVSNPTDVYEQEADRVADQVMRMADPQPQSLTESPVSVQRKCNECEEQLRRSPESPAVPSVGAATEQAIGSLSGRGSPLPESVRAFMEPRFNADFKAVRVHTDANAHSLARAVEAKAFTVGNDVVFGAGHFAPATDDGKRLLAHELAHTIQQRGAAPRIARSADSENVLRLSITGEIVTVERLILWAIAQNRPMAQLIQEVRGSHTFSGSDEIRKLAAETLRTANEVLLIDEAREEAEVARKFGAASARRHRWLAGYGTIRDNVLPQAGGPRSAEGGAVFFETYDLQGGLIWQSYPNADAYGNAIRAQLEKVDRRCHSLAEEVVEYIKLDKKNVSEAHQEAAWYQRPGLALPGVRMGFSKVALVNAEIAIKYAREARVKARAALRELARNQGTPAGKGLNEARVLLLQATHSLQAMLRTREAEDEATLGRLDSYSKAGDYAAIGTTAPLQIFLSLAKNAAVRGARMHSDPSAEFGFLSFAKETAITLGSVKLERWLGGAHPGFVREVGASLVTNQIGKAAQKGDVAQLWNFDAFEAGLAIGAPAYTRLRAGVGTPEFQAPATGMIDPNATTQPNAGSQGAASASPPTYEQYLLTWGQNQPARTDTLANSSTATPGVASSQAQKAKVIGGFGRATESKPTQPANETTTVVAGFVGEPAKVPWSAELDPPLPPREVGFKSEAARAASAEIRHRGGNNWSIGEFTLLATRQLRGNVFQWDISHVGHSADATPSTRDFVKCLFADAAHSGASLLRITGAKLDPAFTKQLALDVRRNYAGTVRRGKDGNVEILIPVPQTSTGAVPGHRDKTYKPVLDDLGTVAPAKGAVASAGNGRTGDPLQTPGHVSTALAPPSTTVSGSTSGRGPTRAEEQDQSTFEPTVVLAEDWAFDELSHNAVRRARRAMSDARRDGVRHQYRDPKPEGPDYKDPKTMRGACGFSSSHAARSLVGAGVPAEQIYMNQASEISGVQGLQHTFVVYARPDGVDLLIDPSFAQFTGSRNGHVEALLASEPGGAQLRSDLIQNGYTVLTQDIAQLYLRAVSEAREVPAVQAADFKRDRVNLGKNPALIDPSHC